MQARRRDREQVGSEFVFPAERRCRSRDPRHQCQRVLVKPCRGFAFNQAINSFRFWAGMPFRPTIISGSLTSARNWLQILHQVPLKRIKSARAERENLWSRCSACSRPQVHARARPTPILPAAPPTFSMMTGWPRNVRRSSAIIRPITSDTPPGANGTIMVIGRVG